MIRVLRTWSVGIAVLLLTSAPAWAQATAELNGRVTDESGAVLPGVTVTATQTETGFTRTVVTDGDGTYVIPNLPTGPYRLEVSLQGFRTYVQTGIVLQVGGHADDQRVARGGKPRGNGVSRGGNAAGRRPQRWHLRGGRAGADLELPLQGRQVTDLIVLAGAAVQIHAECRRACRVGVHGSVAGGLPFGVAYLLDGATHNNPYDNLNLPLPFPDALQEFRVATSGLSAENGMHSARRSTR